MMIISREFSNITWNIYAKENIHDALVVLQIAAMLIQQMHTGLGILQAVQLSSDMFEYTVDITWYNIHTLHYMNHAAI
jgi:hypothetical protein